MGKDVVLITGSGGRIGKALINKLDDGYDIVGCELNNASNPSPQEDRVVVDISSPDSLAKALQHVKQFYGNKISSVVHLAAYYSFKDQNYQKYKEITVKGTKNLLQALQGFDVEQFIFSSTMLVHKPQDPNHKINEDSPMAGSWAYPRSKIETEEVIRQFHGQIPTVILRIAGAYDDECHSIPIANQIQRIYEKQFASRIFPGKITHGASFIHMDDLVDSLLLAIQKRSALPKQTVLLIGDDETLSTDQLQRKISKNLLGKEIRTFSIPKAIAWFGVTLQGVVGLNKNSFIQPWMVHFADDNYSLDVTLATKVLGWKPKRHLSRDLDLILKNMKKDPKGWYKMNGLVPSRHLRHRWKKEKG